MKILIVGPAWVGDMVMSQSLYKVLKQERPGCELHVLAPEWSRPLLERMPEVDRAIDLPFGHGVLALGERRRLGVALRMERYDQAILLPNSLKSALVPWWANIPQRTGWRGEMRYGLLNDLRRLDESRLPLMVERFVALARPDGATLPGSIPRPRLLIDDLSCMDALQTFGLSPSQRPVLALCPGAEFGNSKRWPSAHFAEIAGERIARGWQVWLFGSAKDREVTDAIVASLPDSARAHCENLAGKTRLSQAIDLLSLASAVVSNDSGLMHIAAALDRPLVAVYGSTSPRFTPPLASRVRIETVSLSCSPCFQRECPLGHGECMTTLLPAQVSAALSAVEAG